MVKLKDPLSKQLARRLRAARAELTLVQFARKLGISKSSLQRMEVGEQNVTLETLDVLCARMKCEVGELFDKTSAAPNRQSPPKRRVR